MAQLPPLPEGFSLDQTPASPMPGLPPLPEGFALDAPAAAPQEQSSFEGNVLRSAVGQGLMLSTGDEALAFARSKWFGTPYEEELAKERGKLQQFREEYPVGSTVAEIAGGAALPVAGVAGGVARAGASLARAGAVGRAVARPVAAVGRAMELKKGDSLARTALAGGTTATAFGAPALYGAGEGGVAERAANTAENLPLVAGIGAVGAPTARAIGGGLAGILRHVGSTPRQIATRRAGEAMEAGNIDPEELIKQIAPVNARARVTLTPQQEEAIISARMGNTPWTQISRDTGLSDSVVRRVWRDFEAKRTRAPLNIMERASLAGGDQGPGAARPLYELGRAGANLPGKGQAVAFERSMERQLGQRGRVETLVDDTFGDDFAPRIAAVEERLTKQAGDQYDQLYARSPVHVDDDLAKVIVTPVARPFWEKARALAAAEGRFIPTFDEIAFAFQKSPTKALGFLAKSTPPAVANVPATLTLPVRAIDYFQRALRLEAKGAFQSGRGAEGATAKAIRKRLLDVVDARIPGYKAIREAYSEGKTAEEALKAGRSFIGRAGQKTDDLMKAYAKYTPEQQELFQIGMGQQMKDMLANKQATHDLTASMRTPAAQAAYRKVLGAEKANRFINDVLQEAEITRSTRFLTEGSRTAPMQQAQAKLLEEEQFVSDVLSLKPMGLISGTAKRLARALSERNNAALIDILTTTDEGKMLAALREIKAALNRSRRQISGRGAVPAVAATGVEIGKAQSRN